MVGNDIVDLHEAAKSSNWKRKRFIEILFTKQEQKFIEESDNAFKMIWRLWGMKESAYKLYIQCYPDRFFNPRGFECCIDKNFGTVKFKSFECALKTVQTSDYILSEARFNNTNTNSKVIYLEGMDSNTQSALLKAELLKDLAQELNVQNNQLSIRKDCFGIPKVYCGKTFIHVSLTHHGNFAAHAIA